MFHRLIDINLTGSFVPFSVLPLGRCRAFSRILSAQQSNGRIIFSTMKFFAVLLLGVASSVTLPTWNPAVLVQRKPIHRASLLALLQLGALLLSILQPTMTPISMTKRKKKMLSEMIPIMRKQRLLELGKHRLAIE